MERLTVQQQRDVTKMSSEHLRALLIAAGYNEDTVTSLERQALLDAYAEHYLSLTVEGAMGGIISEEADANVDVSIADVSMSKVERQERGLRLREQELEMRMMEMKRQREEQEREKEFRKFEMEKQDEWRKLSLIHI